MYDNWELTKFSIYSLIGLYRYVFNEEVYGLCLYMMAIYLTVVWVAICAIIAYLYKREFESRSGRGVLDATLCNEVCQWLVGGR